MVNACNFADVFDIILFQTSVNLTFIFKHASSKEV